MKNNTILLILLILSLILNMYLLYDKPLLIEEDILYKDSIEWNIIKKDSIELNIIRKDSIINVIHENIKKDEQEILNLNDSSTIELFHKLAK